MPAFATSSLPVSSAQLGITLFTSGLPRLGASVSSAGDLNGDGFSDFVIGTAPYSFEDRSAYSGTSSAYVVFGGASGSSLNVATASAGVGRVGGIQVAVNFGITVSSAGDVNGDGLSDVLFGSATSSPDGRGSIYLLTGRTSGFGDIDVNAGAPGLTRIIGGANNDGIGQSVAGAGDFNGDGYADIVVGGSNSAAIGSPGLMYVVFGSAGGISSINFGSGGNALRLNGAVGNEVGRVVAGAGDLNGDGYADVVTANGSADPLGRTDAGMVTILFGNANGPGSVTVSSLGASGFRIFGAAAGDQAGYSVAPAGDVNGDGWGDLIIGAPFANNNGRTGNGAAYVIFGHAGGFSDIDLAQLGNAGFRIDGDRAQAGLSVASSGDVNGDGFSDILIGAPALTSASGGSAVTDGLTYLLLGHDGAFPAVDLRSTSSYAASFGGTALLGRAGQSVASAGDSDGDGFSDIIIGAPGYGPLPTPGVPSESDAYLLYSQSTGGALYRGTTLADTLRGTPDADTLFGFGQNDRLFGNAGDDTLNGGVGNDVIDGGAGTDTAVYSGLLSQYVYGVIGDQAIISGADGTDRLSGVEFLQFGNGERVALSSFATNTGGLYVTSGGLGSGFRLPDLYSGPVTRLQAQLLGSAGGDIALGTGLNDFFNLLGGDDAVQAGAGDDVIDGGTGSNFLTGGAGRDDFFLDGRSLTNTWSTITDWQPGETLSLFGWNPGISRMLWRDSDGTTGYKGVTLHTDLDGNDVYETSVTWTGLTQAALPTPQSLAGLLWFV